MIVPVEAAGIVVLGLAVLAALVLAAAAEGTATVSLAEPAAEPGELLVIDPGGDAEQTVVVRRVMRDLTAGHVVLVRPYRRWHRWRRTRRWL